MLTLLKLDFFFVFSFAAQLIPSVLLRYDDDYTETILVFVLGGIGLTLALLAVYKENLIAHLTFIVAGLLATAYFIYKLVVIATPVTGDYDPYEHTRQFLIFTTVIAIVLVLSTVLVACKCCWNVKNKIFLFKDSAPHKKTYDQNDQMAIDNESFDDEEMNHAQGSHSPDKTLLQPTHTRHEEKTQVMWAIE